MLRSPRRARARRVSRAITLAASAALVVTVAPVLALSSASSAAPAAPDSVWSPTSARPGASHQGNVRQVNPSDYQAYTLDGDAFAAALRGAPAAGTDLAQGAEVRVPAPNGTLVDFKVVQSQVLAPELAKQHPEIRAYVGKAVDHPDSISIQVTPFGTHVSVRGAHKSWFVDPAYQNDDSLYLSYFGQDLPEPEKAFAEPEIDESALADIKSSPTRIGEGPNGLAKQRLYRLALLTDPTYAEYVAPGLNTGSTEAESDSAVLAAKTVLMSRVNDVYGDDLGITLQLIAGTDKLNLNRTAEATGANGPCGLDPCFTTANLDPANGCISSLLTRNRLVVGQLIGAGNFDIGHIGLGINGGGVASLAVVGGNNKAQGCTGLPQPIGDFYAIDYVAHEMGHQFNGPHTFNGTQLNCSGGNRSGGSSVEPGSGSSVMAYAGICQQDNLQPHSDPYFSQRTQTDIGTYINSAINPVTEVQSVAFSGFDATDGFTLTFDGVGTTAPIVRGTNYTAAGIKAAVEAVFTAAGKAVTVTVAGHFGGTFGDSGFQLTFGGTDGTGVDIVNPTLAPTTGSTFTSLVNDIAKGGPATNAGFTVTTPGNHNPAVTAPADKFLPIRTPFTLTGSATDQDGDQLLYLWEQNDRGGANGTALVDNTKRNGPLFRVFGTYANVTPAETLKYYSAGENLADTNPSRTFPDMDQILAGNTNAATGACPAAPAAPTAVPIETVNCFSEFLPTADYVGDGTAQNTEPSLNFRLTARDQKGVNGGTDFDDVKLRLDKTAGPFLVTSQAAATTLTAGTTQAITWDVNGTNKASLAPNVKISFSSDGGKTFGTVLAASTPNDGSESVRVPAIATTQGRIKIEAVDNYFFDVNDAPITVAVTDTTPPETFFTSGPTDRSYLLATSATFGLGSSEAGSTFTCTLDGAPLACSGTSVSVSGLAPGSHVITAAATDPLGNRDQSPATVVFTVPVDDAALAAAKGPWKRTGDAAAYLGTVSQAKKKGSMLSTTVSGAKSIALVVSTGKRLGAVKVKLNGQTLSTVSLKGKRGRQQVVLVSDVPTAGGTLTITSTTKKKVVVDGLIVVTKP